MIDGDMADQLAEAAWDTLMWTVPGDEDNEEDLQSLGEALPAAVSSFTLQLLESVRAGNAREFLAILDAHAKGELGFRSRLGQISQLRHPYDRENAAHQQIASQSFDLFRLAVGQVVSWAFIQSLSDRVSVDSARSMFEHAQRFIVVDGEHLLRLARFDQRTLLFDGVGDTDWMWEVPRNQVFSIGADLGAPYWAFVLNFLKSPPEDRILVPTTDDAAVFADPQQMIGSYVDDASRRLDHIANFLRTDEIGRARLADHLGLLRRQLGWWRQQFFKQRYDWVQRAPLSDDEIHRFVTEAREGYDTNRLLRRTPRQWGLTSEEIPDLDVQPWSVPPQAFSREAFISGGRVGLGFTARGLGEALALAELKAVAGTVLEEASTSGNVLEVEGERLDAELDRLGSLMSETGRTPNLIMFTDARLRMAIGLDARDRAAPRHKYLLGTRKGSWVVSVGDLPPGTLVLASLSGSKIRHGLAGDGHPLLVEVREPTENEITSLAEGYRRTHQVVYELEPLDWAKTQVIVRAEIRVEFLPEDGAACHALRVTAADGGEE